jgi:predicted nucleic acid-binding protein
MKPSFVLDCSMAAAWCFLEEATDATVKLLKRMEHEAALIPAWWYIELTNVLALAERKGRIDAQQVSEFIQLVEGFQLEVDAESHTRASSHLLPLCRSDELTSYDAVYLDLTLRRQLSLASLDEPLRKAAKKHGVKVLGK